MLLPRENGPFHKFGAGCLLQIPSVSLITRAEARTTVKALAGTFESSEDSLGRIDEQNRSVLFRWPTQIATPGAGQDPRSLGQ
jgi:hypothetical protein